MNWFTNVLRNLSPPATGLEVDEADPLAIQVRRSPGQFVRALVPLVDEQAQLYLEGRTHRNLAAWLDRLTLEPRPQVSVGISPVQDFYHLAMDPAVLEDLAIRLDQPGAVGRRLHLHVHENDRIVLQWRRAFSDAPVLVSRRLPAERVQAFIAVVG